MISKHIDVVAVFALLLGILVFSELKNSVWIRMMQRPAHLRVEQISVRVPEPPVVPIVFE